MAINNLLGSAKRKVGAGVLGLGLVMGSYGGMGCGEDTTANYGNRPWTCESGWQMIQDLCYPYLSSEEKEEAETHFLKGCRKEINEGATPQAVDAFVECIYQVCNQGIQPVYENIDTCHL